MAGRLSSILLSLLVAFSLAGMVGCGLVGGPSSGLTSVVGSPAVSRPTGIVHGGQQPVTGATIQLYAIGTTGYGSAATPLIGATVTTSDGSGLANSNANAGNGNNSFPVGTFSITGAYTCPSASTLVYLLATGGNPGQAAGTNNSAIVMMTALGQCGSLSSSTFITINEVTTVASAYALAQFTSFTGNVGDVSGFSTGVINAFASVKNMVNIATGVALASDAAGNTVPQSTINTFANTVVPCVNSTGPTSSACSALIAAVFPSLNPQTVLAALIDLALFPNGNASNLFSLSTSNAPFQPALSSAPHNWTLTIGNAASLCGYSGPGATVSGVVNYTGVQTGRIYLALSNNNCSTDGTMGTSISSKGGFAIKGVPPGVYNLSAFMDTLGFGNSNTADPVGFTGGINVSTNNVGGQALTLSDAATVTLTSAPSLSTISPYDSGALIQFSPIKSNGTEVANSYTLQWSTSSSFSSVAGSHTFHANGTHHNAWLATGLTNGSAYYFRVYGSSAGTAVGPFSTTYGPVTIGAPSTGSSVSGAVSFTGTATGPMYVGLYNQYTSTAYLQYIANPVNLQAYTVLVPNSAAAVYQPVVVLDQNNDNQIDSGDLTNIDNNPGGIGISITGTTANLNMTLPSGNSSAALITQSFLTGNYSFQTAVQGLAKLPVVVTLQSSNNADGANVTGPIDIALCGQGGTNCGQGFQISFNLAATPTIGDTYFFNVGYSDGTSGVVTAAVTGVLTNFATGLAPTTGTSVSTTPTFTWVAPVCGLCSNYVYTFELDLSNSGSIWQVPGNANGLPYSTTSLAWGVDPTNASNPPTVSSLTLGTAYTWNVTVVDTNGNQAITQANYTP